MENLIRFNSQQECYKKPFGAVTKGAKVTFKIEVSTNIYVTSATCIFNGHMGQDEYVMIWESSKMGYASFFCEVVFQGEVGNYWYYFLINSNAGSYYYGNNEKCLGGKGITSLEPPRPFQQTVYQKENIAKWFTNSIMYQINVDRFFAGGLKTHVANHNEIYHACWNDAPFYARDCKTSRIIAWDYFGGNLQGVAEKLDYLKKLHVGTIYLNPIFLAASNHKYDTADYEEIDSHFGNKADFIDLCKSAAAAEIRIMLDGVFSHTGDDSKYFNKYGNYQEVGAYNSKSSPYYKWYEFTSYPEKYTCWWGVDSLPNVHEMESSYLAYIINNEKSIIRSWLMDGASGWRLDVADELPVAFLQALKKVAQETKAEAVIMGEVWEDASHKVSYGEERNYFTDKCLDTVMNYPFRNKLAEFLLNSITSSELISYWLSLQENYPEENYYALSNATGSHDIMRILTLLGESPAAEKLTEAEKRSYRLPPKQRELGLVRLRLFYLVQMTFPGVPTIYYGDEAGVEGYTDPYNRGTYPWNNVEHELLVWVQELSELRNNETVLVNGALVYLETDGKILAFLRKGIRNFAILLNASNETQQLSINVSLSELIICTGLIQQENQLIKLGPFAGGIWKFEEGAK
ncbi:MAG: glycoside hydrolase family 13 protein [Clostridia bacterium]